MRLINVHSLELEDFVLNVPRYAILSHCWTEDEVSYEEFRKGLNTNSKGFSKIKEFCDCIKRGALGPSRIDYVWVDT